MKTIILDALVGDNYLNRFMHCADVFESFKQLADYQQITLDVSFKDDEIERAENTVNILVDAFKESDKNVVFVSIREIDGIRVNMKNYIMPNVSVISSEKKWFMFHEFLKRIGYNVETNEHMQVIKAQLK